MCVVPAAVPPSVLYGSASSLEGEPASAAGLAALGAQSRQAAQSGPHGAVPPWAGAAALAPACLYILQPRYDFGGIPCLAGQGGPLLCTWAGTTGAGAGRGRAALPGCRAFLCFEGCWPAHDRPACAWHCFGRPALWGARYFCTHCCAPLPPGVLCVRVYT